MLTVPRRLLGWVMTIYALAFLIAVHIERMVNDYGGWHLGVSTCIMLSCINLSSFAWDYTDGGADPKTLSSEQKKNAIKDAPSFIEFFTFAVCPTQCFSGPSCNYVDFRDYVYHLGDFQNVPSTIVPCLKRFCTGMCFVAGYVVLHANFPPELIRGPEFYKSCGFLRRVRYISIHDSG